MKFSITNSLNFDYIKDLANNSMFLIMLSFNSHHNIVFCYVIWQIFDNNLVINTINFDICFHLNVAWKLIFISHFHFTFIDDFSIIREVWEKSIYKDIISDILIIDILDTNIHYIVKIMWHNRSDIRISNTIRTIYQKNRNLKWYVINFHVFTVKVRYKVYNFRSNLFNDITEEF